jgi:hypothetical protein
MKGAWMRRRLISSARALVGVGVLALLVVRMGVAPFVDAIGALRGPAVVWGLAISALTTIFCVWRWREVARGLGIPVPMRAAVGAYYQSQFLDATLPGGVLGDLHRGVSHGRHVGAVGRGLRAVVWERSLGQVVQLSLTVLLVPLLLVIVASGLPANVAGWGPREGAAAWAFGAAGLGAAHGVTTAVVYGVMGLVATLPGAIVLVAGRPLHAASRRRGASASAGAIGP